MALLTFTVWSSFGFIFTETRTFTTISRLSLCRLVEPFAVYLVNASFPEKRASFSAMTHRDPISDAKGAYSSRFSGVFIPRTQQR
ncbi:hypothetical protein C8J57DRAFT_1279428 [Mycena rebaudengoi]|nr:hypothetical protein C8J57DRAFT_1279428 [Mycena rebaudengoi]